ncbi:MAG: mitochondrial fission ELM1 family protein [Pseudomonadota bacterium]
MPAPPRIWVLQAEKSGDNAQMQALVEAVGLPATVKRLRMRRRWQLGKPRIRASLRHLDPGASDPLLPPWPDLVVASGRRLMNVALWLREQSAGTRLVLVGRPHGHDRAFDLIVAAPQFQLPPRPNVLNLSLPLIIPPRAAIEQAVLAWRPALSALTRPLTAVLVGGPTRPFRFGPAQAQALIAETLAASGGAGTLYLSTSRRTPPAVVDALEAALPPGGRLFRWAPEASDNPYLALLGSADRFVATGDSASMLVEVARLGRPLSIFELPVAQGPRQLLARAQALVRRRPQRDLTALHRVLYRLGLARPLGQGFSPASDGVGPSSELVEIRSRVRALLGLGPA